VGLEHVLLCYTFAVLEKKQRLWCVGERRPTGSDEIFFVSRNFRKREDAEKEMERLSALSEKADRRLFVTLAPQEEPKPRRLRKTTRR